jgi:hypothetical protein
MPDPSSRMAAQASPRAAGVARPSGMAKPPPCRPVTGGAAASWAVGEPRGPAAGMADTGRPAQRAASAGGTPCAVSRRITSSRARSSAV